MHMWANLDTWVSNKEKKAFLYLLLQLFVVGVQKARKIAGSFNLPMVGVHHMEAHALVARYTGKRYVAVCLFTANMSRYRLPDIMYQSNFNFLLFCFVLTSECEWPFLHCEVQKSPLSTWHWEFSMLVYGTFCQWKHKRIVKHVLLWLTYFPSSRITEQELQFPFMALLISGVDFTNLMFF